MHDDEGTLLFVEVAEAALDLVTVGQDDGRVGCDPLDRHDRGLVPPAAPVAASLFIARVHEQTSQPGFEAVRIAESGQVAPRMDERFLGGVIRAGFVPQDEPGDGKEPTDRAARQLRERIPIACHGPFHEIPMHRASRSVCDIVVAEDSAVFGFTEVKLGILPAVISPFSLAKIGRSAARELFLTGARFSASRAREIGLVHAVVPAAQLDSAVGDYVRELLTAAPEAVAAAKALIREVWARPLEQARPLTAEAIATRRVSAEGQEGLRAFLEKRKPSWTA